MLTRKRLLLLNQTDPNLLFEDLFNGAAVNANFWTKTDTYTDEEQVTNGTFTSDISGWTDASDAGSSIAWGGAGPKNMSMISDGAGFSRGRASVTAISGKAYTLSAVGTADMTYKIGTSAGGSQIATAAIGGSGVLSVGFTATAATIHIEFSHNTAATRPLDTVSVKATTGLISVSGGNLDFAGGKTTPAWADPALVSVPNWARQAGLTIEWQVTPGAANKELLVGFTDGSLATNAAEAHGIYFKDTGNLSVILNAATGTVIPLAYTAVSTWARIVLKATGAYYYVSTDNRVTWKLIWIDSTVTTTPLYAFIESYNAALTASKVEVRQGSVKPAVLSASPGAPALTPGAEMLTDPGLEGTYTGGLVAALTAFVSPTVVESADAHGGSKAQQFTGTASGSRVSQQVLGVVGTWYKGSAWGKRTAGATGDAFVNLYAGADISAGYITSATYAQLSVIQRATTTTVVLAPARSAASSGQDTVIVDDMSIKPLPFDQTGVLEYIGDAGVKAGVFDANITVAATYHAGFVVCADSATAPTYNLLAYVATTAAKAYLLKNVNGTWTELVAAAITYSAGAELRLVGVGSSWGLYYAGALLGTIQTVDVSSNYGTHCHSFQTGASDTVASFTFDTGVGA